MSGDITVTLNTFYVTSYYSLTIIQNASVENNVSKEILNVLNFVLEKRSSCQKY